jgi:Spy/CpxP family protein refolding chaperone
MWRKAAPLLIILSVAMNLGFLGVWATHAVRERLSGGNGCAHGGADEGVWCPLHRRLDVSPEQWRQIEPRVVEFQASSGTVCGEVDRMRGELLDLIAAAEPDREAIRLKQEEILAGQRRMQELVIDFLLGEKNALTPVQQHDLFDMMRRRSGCTGHGPGRIPLGGGMPCPDTELMKQGHER